MQLVRPIARRASVTPHRPPALPQPHSSPEAIAEIQAFIAIRDNLFAEAEELCTPAKMESAAVANDYVAQCLRPARSPYRGQSLSENDAAPQREKCELVRGRLAQLRQLTAVSSRAA